MENNQNQDPNGNPNGNPNPGQEHSNPGEGGSPPDWREALPPELKGEKEFENYKDIPSLAKAHLETKKYATKLRNEKGIIIPDEKATPEAWDAYWKALGRPDTPDAYGLEKPELPDGMTYDEERTKAFAAIAHKEGLTAKQLKALHGAFNDMEKERFEAMSKAAQDFLETSTATVKKEWGKDYEANLKQAEAAIDRIFGPDFKKVLKETGLANHPEVVKGMFKASQTIGEHAFQSKGKPAGASGEFTWEKLVSMKLDPRYERKDPAFLKEVEAYNKAYAESLGAARG